MFSLLLLVGLILVGLIGFVLLVIRLLIGILVLCLLLLLLWFTRRLSSLLLIGRRRLCMVGACRRSISRVLWLSLNRVGWFMCRSVL